MVALRSVADRLDNDDRSNMPSSLRKIGFIAFGAVAIALLAISTMAYRSVIRLNDANELVAHTYQVLSALEAVLTTMVDAETGTRGYGVTGLSRYREPFDRARTDITERVDAVATLTADNPSQRRLATELRTQTDTTILLLQQMVTLGKLRQPIPIDLRDREKASMDSVRSTLQQMRSAEQQLMERRDLSAGRAETIMLALTLGLVVAAFTVLGASFRLVRRHAVQLRETNAQLNDRVQTQTAELRQRTAELEEALTNEQAAREEAQAANRAKDEFLMTISHELRTPLNVIYGWSRMLAKGQLKQDQGPRALEAIYRSAEVQHRLINDLLDTSRMLSGKLQLNLKVVNIAQIVRSAVDSIEPAAQAKSVRLEVDLDDEVYLSGDADRLRQVTLNLLSNAVNFTPSGGRVLLRLERKASDVDITVTDSGEGIDTSFLPLVFERFRQADASTTRSHGGLGLGLAIVRSVVELHGGSVEASSEGIGHGATFRIRLPVSTAELPEPRFGDLDAQQWTSTALDGVSVLVVDDEALARELLATILEEAGAEVRSASSVASALRILEMWAPAVLISDIAMPGEDGYALIRKVRARSGTAIHAIAVTAYVSADESARALQAGYDRHLAKPVEPNGLVAVVADLVAMRQELA